MKYDHILIRYGGEMTTKGRNRKQFITRLKTNIKRALRYNDTIQIIEERDRMFIMLNGVDHEPIAAVLKEMFGVQSFSLAVKVERDIELMKEAGLLIMTEATVPQTFKVETRRADKTFELDTNEVNYAIGSHVLRNTEHLTVDVRKPAVKLQVEVRADAVYMMGGTIQGPGGYPVGTNGRAMLMLSGGIDSPVAGYMLMRRGIEIEAVHFHSPPYTSERAKQKVIDLTKKLTKFGGQIKLHIVPFTTIQQTIHQQVPENNTLISTRRMMLRITDVLREQQKALTIASGESLGQVASQTMESMVAINAVTTTPVLRPLVAMDKNEIVDIAQRIDTFDISSLPYEDCCTVFVPVAPKTKPKVDKVAFYESFIDFDTLIAEAVANVETLIIRHGEEEQTFTDLL